MSGFDFDVIIVGSRPSGSSLAIRLGEMGFSVLVLDKDVFPSASSISCPAIFASTMQLLDELGIDELDYSYNTPKISSFIIEIRNYFKVQFEIGDFHGRNYVYCIDRKRFDNALFEKANSDNNVTIIQGFKVINVIYQNGYVVGVSGQDSFGEKRQYKARCVVGADGRFSTISRLVCSPILKEWKNINSAILYSYWKNVCPYDNEDPKIQFFAPKTGLLFMLMESAENKTGVVIHGEPKNIFCTPNAKDSYMKLLKNEPSIWGRLKDAEQINSIKGVRILKNIYRKGGGLGWFLTGDALHHRDTLDAQGIYEALLSSKLLAVSIELVLKEKISWDDAINRYQKLVYLSTLAMCKTTLNRLLFEHRVPWPSWFVKTVVYWLFSNPEYQEKFVRLHLRDIDPKNWMNSTLIFQSILKGIRNEILK